MHMPPNPQGGKQKPKHSTYNFKKLFFKKNLENFINHFVEKTAQTSTITPTYNSHFTQRNCPRC